MNAFLATKLIDSNTEYSEKRKKYLKIKNTVKNFPVKIWLALTRQG